MKSTGRQEDGKFREEHSKNLAPDLLVSPSSCANPL
jgi:hypothetical protein